MPPPPARHCGWLAKHVGHNFFASPDVNTAGQSVECVHDVNPGNGTEYRCNGKANSFDPGDWLPTGP